MSLAKFGAPEEYGPNIPLEEVQLREGGMVEATRPGEVGKAVKDEWFSCLTFTLG